MGHDVYLYIVTTPSQRHNVDPIRLRLTDAQITQVYTGAEITYNGTSYMVERTIYSLDFNCLNVYAKAITSD